MEYMLCSTCDLLFQEEDLRERGTLRQNLKQDLDCVVLDALIKLRVSSPESSSSSKSDLNSPDGA